MKITKTYLKKFIEIFKDIKTKTICCIQNIKLFNNYWIIISRIHIYVDLIFIKIYKVSK